jgi:hypothetical protein
MCLQAILFARAQSTQCREQTTVGLPLWIFVLLVILAMLDTVQQHPDWLLLATSAASYAILSNFPVASVIC